MQSNLPEEARAGLHVGLIMDGNGRWARRRRMPRIAGHRAGARVVRRIVEAAPALGVGALTLYAFSADNWRRPAAEVSEIMRLLGRTLSSESPRLARAGVRLSVIGRRDRLAPPLCAAIERAEAATAAGRRMHLRVAVDYSAREAILRAAAAGDLHREAIARRLTPDVDLLIRTGGEQRLSDFLLWECAYAELLFLDRPWPDFRESDLAAAVAAFHGRERRFGGLPAPADDAFEPSDA